jgi:hypothetical protein
MVDLSWNRFTVLGLITKITLHKKRFFPKRYLFQIKFQTSYHLLTGYIVVFVEEATGCFFPGLFINPGFFSKFAAGWKRIS